MSEQLQAYCVKCQTKRDLANPEATYTKTGTPAVKGVCPVCKTKLFRMGRIEAHENLPKPQKSHKPGRTSKRKYSRKKPLNIGKLVIVESPAKARSVGGFLGNNYTVLASKGHVRDLLVTRLSVDVENDFEPTYRVPNEKRPVVKQLKEAVESASDIYLATDPDREGEAIAWHLIAATEMDHDKVKRVVFHEITDSAVEDAFSHPRKINQKLVDAQQARRILDRLVGYNVTQLLWRKVRGRLSAGRVQSVALRMAVDREREIEQFTPQEYWTIDANLRKPRTNGKDSADFIARLIKIDGKEASLGSEEEVQPHLKILNKSQYIVADVNRGVRQRRPSPPFTTSTLQQEASRRLGFNARRTMQIAQQLYEGIQFGKNGHSTGLITYMRTDSVTISGQAQTQARNYIEAKFGKDYIPAKPPKYKNRTKGAQEAHEAIRPTGIDQSPDDIKAYLSRDQYKLYKLIWERFIASQMANAVYNTLRIDIQSGLKADDLPYLFRATGSQLKFAGFLALYEDSKDEDTQADNDEGRILPDLTANELLALVQLLPEQHFTQPPPRYTEASLVRQLEEYGIGRPSTYAPTVAVIQDRDYVTKDGNRLMPTEIGKIVNDLLVKYFPEEMDYKFTARLEEQLDDIAEGETPWQPVLREFYAPFEQRLENARKHMPKVQQEELIGRKCPSCGDGDLGIKHGRWGKFIGCTNYPECRYTEKYLERTGILCPTCGEMEGGELVIQRTKKGRTFYGCSRYPECEHSQWTLPKKQTQHRKEEQDKAVQELSSTG